MKKIFLVCLIVIFLSGCAQTSKFVYPSKAENLIQLYKETKYNLRVAVLPFEEKRGDINKSNYIFYLIPLMIVTSGRYERPDAARPFLTTSEFDFDVSEDIAKAVVTSLKRSNLFKDVFFTFGGESINADLVIKGDIESMRYIGKLYSYGISVACPVLWLLGLPAGTSYNELSLRLYLTKKDVEEPIWEYAFTKESLIVQGIYYNWGKDVKGYTSLLEEGVNDAVQSLDRKLSSINLNQ